MPPPTLGAADRLLSFYGNELLARSGTLASVKSFGSQASASQSVVGGVAGTADGGGRPDGNDVVIDPYELNSSDLESSSESGFESDGGQQEISEPGDGDSTDWSASGYGDPDEFGKPPPDGPDDGRAVLRSAGGGGGAAAAASRSRVSSAAGLSVKSRGSGTAGPGRDFLSVRSRASVISIPDGAGGAAAAGRRAGGGSVSNFNSFKSRASASTIRSSGGVAAATDPRVSGGAGRALISFKKRASSIGGAAAAAAPSVKSRVSSVRGAVAGGGGGRDLAESYRSRASGGGGGGGAMSVGGGSSRVTVQRAATAPNTAKNRLSGKNVRRRLLRRRGWDFDLTPGEIDFQLGRHLPDVLTRPQPTVNSEDEEASEGNGSSGGGDDDGSLSAGGDEPPPGPALDAIKSYAKERAPEVLWSERLRSAKLTARATGQTVTVRGRLDRKRRRELARKIQKWDNREWFASRKRTPPAPPLHPAVVRVIEQWFALVDDDGSGTLDHSELLAALRASNVPVSPDNINEMINLMDLDGDGVINWKEFETFFMYEFAAGKNLLSGEYVLPSGVALPFGAMIAKLKRNRLLSDLTEGGKARAKWTQVAENPMEMEDELGMMAAVEMAMEEMKNPALSRQRNRAAKALNRLPPHLRTKSMGRHLERHPEITEKLLRASSIAPLLLNTMKRSASTSSQVMARLASQGSQGSVNSSAAPSVVSGNSSGPSNGGGRGRNVDLNVAAALAAGLEWPVNGANFYNRRARTILRSVCQRPAETLLRNQQNAAAAASKLAAAKAAVVAAAATAEGAAPRGARPPRGAARRRRRRGLRLPYGLPVAGAWATAGTA